MKLKYLFKEIPNVVWKGDKELEITAITANSKTALPGAIFLAKRGIKGDGHRYIAEAVEAGATAVVTDSYDPFLAATQIIHANVNAIEAALGHRFYGNPSQKLSIIGVTGTSGKTTTTYLIQHLLKNCGLIGSVVWMTGKKVFPSAYTTPDLLTTLQLFHEMKEDGCTTAAVEVSSHALDQGRVQGVEFSMAVFTNFSQDHLDYHSTMEEYAAVKAELFANLSKSSIAIINIDDTKASLMMQNSPASIITFGFSEHADLYASDLHLSAHGMDFYLHWKDEKVVINTQLIGRFNVYNILAAAAVALKRGISLQEIAKTLADFTGIPGRLERVVNSRGLQVFVDHAHKPEALRNVLETLNEFKQGRLITVFGCGGNRDALKRPLMASIAEQLSDVVILTNDNPRFEDPEKIAQDVIKGFQGQKYIIELDRKKAIEQALAMATSADLILIAGKGHETYQIFAHRTIHFDDREIIKELC